MWISRKKWRNLEERVADLEKQLQDQQSDKKLSIRLDCMGSLTNAEANDIIHRHVEEFKKQKDGMVARKNRRFDAGEREDVHEVLQEM